MLFTRLLNLIKRDEQKNKKCCNKTPQINYAFTFVIKHTKRFIIETLEDTPVHKILGQNRLKIWSLSLGYSLYMVNLKQLGVQSSVTFF